MSEAAGAAPEPKWRRFEALVHSIQKQLSPNAVVTHDDKIMGTKSGTQRQIDISVKVQVGPYAILIVLDCKDYGRRVDVKDVEAFVGLAQDVRANKGAMVTTVGFSDAAVAVARAHGIDTFLLVDTESVDWRTYASIWCILKRTLIRQYAFRYSGTSAHPFCLPTDREEQMAMVWHASDGRRIGTPREALANMWESQTDYREAGEYQLLLGEDLQADFRGKPTFCTLHALIRVEEKLYYGPVPVHLQGFHNVQTGATMTRELRTEFIEPATIERGLVPNWREINDPSSVTGVTMTLVYSDVYDDWRPAPPPS